MLQRSAPLRAVLGLALLVFALLTYLNIGLTLQQERNQRRLSQLSSFVLPSAEVLAITSLNHRVAAADLVWVNAILYASEHYSARRHATEVTDFADAMIALDPYFKPVYLWHNSVRMSVNHSIEYEDVAAANAVLKRGLQTFPEEWIFAQAIVANHIGHRYSRTPEEHLADMEEAYTYAKLGSEMPGAPDEMMFLATSFQRRLTRARAVVDGEELDETQSAASPAEVAYLMRGYFAATDPARQQFMLRQLYELGAGAELIGRIESYRRAFDREHQRRAYLPPDVFSLAEPALYRVPGTLEAADDF